MPAYAVDSVTGPTAAPPPTAAPAAPDPLLADAVARDLALGRRITALTWLLALLHAILGFVAFRQAALLVGLDSRLVTNSVVEDLGSAALPVRLAFVAVMAVSAIVGVMWLRRAVRTMEALAAAGGVDGGRRPASGLGRLAVLFRPSGVPAERVTWNELRVGGGRRLALAALVATLVAVAAGLAAAMALAGANGVADARAARLAAGIAAGLWAVASILLGAVVADVVWRMAVAARAVGIFAPLSDSPGRLAFRLVPAVLVFGGLAPLTFSAPAGQPVDCGTSSLECASVEVPVDHAVGAPSGSFRLVYGIHRAYGERVGTMVVAVGGPGASGLESAEARLAGFDPELLGRYDIVFWDQRGIGRSDGRDCPIAGGIYSAVETTADAARKFVDACLKEAGTGSIGLRRYATVQAAEDLESIREQLGVDRFVLYGESYGTELAQIYAAAHPDRLSALILDGAVDLTLSSNDFWSQATRSFDRSLRATLNACSQDELCSADLSRPADAYDRLLASLAAGERRVSFGDLDGVVREHAIGHDTVESAFDSLLYEPAGRMLIQRAVAASSRGDDVPLGRLAALFGPGISPISTFAYHAVLCADYRVSPTALVDDVDAVLVSGQRSGALSARTDEVYLAQVPCLFWPDQPASEERPRGLTDLPVPILVLAATVDPITPVEFGRHIAHRAADGYLIETEGGAHVTFGRGNPCVDRPVVRFLVSGEPPVSHTVTCPGVVAEPYVPLSPLEVDDFADALDAMIAVENELSADPRITFWNGIGRITVGCRFGGSVGLSSGLTAESYTFDDCEIADGMALRGSGTNDYVSSTLSFDVTFDGGSLKYTSGTNHSVTGTFRGRHVDQHD